MGMASLCSLESVSSVKFKEASIVLMLQSPMQTVPIILVEGSDDVEFYRKQFAAGINVIIPINDSNRGNYHEVTEVTENLHVQFPRCNVIGIRDRDYTLYEKRVRRFSEWVLFSGGHSLECMLLMPEKVRDEFFVRLPDLNGQFDKVISDCRYVADFYIYVAQKGIEFSFKKKKLHLINFFDRNKREMQDSWQEKYVDKFAKNLPDFSKIDMKKIHDAYDLDHVSDWDVCRGHDIVDVCYEMGKAGGIEKKELIHKLIDVYTTEDFLKTSLASDIKNLESMKSIKILKS